MILYIICYKLHPFAYKGIFHRTQQIFETMKHLFFQKGQKLSFAPNNEFLMETSNNLDSKKYVLQRIPYQQFQKEQNYIEKHFYFSRQDNLISYFNCWKETQNIPHELPLVKEKENKKSKKSMLDVMKRKNKGQSQHSIAPSKKKINQEGLNQNFFIQQFIYAQMEYFSQVQVPNDFTNARDFIVVIYLLGRRIQKRTGFVPCLIPVKNEQNDRIKFFKKGISFEIELYKLMIYVFKDKQDAYLRQWSQNLQKSVHKASINHDQHLIGVHLMHEIENYICKPHLINLMNEEKRYCSIQVVKIMNYQILKLQKSQIQLPLSEYKIEYFLKSQADREIILTHEVFQQYILSGRKNYFIVKWLYNMAT